VSGFTTLKVDGHHWRIYGEQQVAVRAVAQPLAVRNKLAAEMACVPARRWWCLRWCWALLVVVVGRALRPLDRLAQAVEGRSASALEPLSTAGSPELLPVALALNSLMQKFEEAHDRAAQLRGRRRARTAFADGACCSCNWSSGPPPTKRARWRWPSWMNGWTAPRIWCASSESGAA
jgi:hypothetical protein